MPSERSKPSEMTGENAARSNVRSISLATRCRPFWTTTSVTGSIAFITLPWRGRSGTRHGVDLRRASGQGTLGPALTAIRTGEHFTAAGRTVHVLGLTRVEGDGDHRRLWLDAHVHPPPARAPVRPAEQGAEPAREIRAASHPAPHRVHCGR